LKPRYCILIFLILIALLHAVPLSAEDISLAVYPSDEELYEAYLRGDLEYETYLNLVQILEDGIDSTDLYLIEEIPNLSYFLQSIADDYSGLQKEQLQSFLEPPAEKKIKRSYIRTRTYQKLEENGDNKTYMYMQTYLNENWTVDARFKESYQGERQWTRRSATYSSNSGQVKKMIFGNYTARFGLGLTVGYRGILLDKDDLSNSETFAFPDYGGFNGVYVEGGRKMDAVKLVLHFDRNNDYNLRLGGIDFTRKFGRFEIEGILVGSNLENRNTDISYSQYIFGSFIRYSKRDYLAALEIALPDNDKANVPSLIFESKYKTDRYTLNFSAWHYGDDFINLSGGGRSGSFYQTVEIDTLDFTFRDRRYDQSGMILRSRVKFERDIYYDVNFSVYGRDQYSVFARLISALEFPVGPSSQIRLDLRNYREKDLADIKSETELRTQYRWRPERFDLRSYVAFTRDKYDNNYMSYFTRIEYDYSSSSFFEAWLNLDKFSHGRGQVDYFYGFIREGINLSETFAIAVKYSYRYNRTYTDREHSIFQLEAVAKW